MPKLQAGKPRVSHDRMLGLKTVTPNQTVSIQTSRQHQQPLNRVVPKPFDPLEARQQQRRDRRCAGIADVQPDHLRRRAEHERPLPKIVVLRDDQQPVRPRVLPDARVRTATLEHQLDVRAIREGGQQQRHEALADVLVQQKLHAAEANRRSRSAAKASTARRSSCVKLGKSSRISASVIPPARYSRMSYTVMRVPAMHGLPLRTSGVMVMRSSRSMRVV
jgi:hypothetical protein